MGQPTPYNITRDFSNDEAGAVAGRSTVLTAALDTELVNIQTTLTGVLSSIAKILRDDDKIKDNLLTPNGFNLSEADGYLQRKTGAWQIVADPTGAAATARDLAIAARVAAEAARDLAQAYRDAASTSATNAATQAGLATSNGAAQVALATTQANNAASSATTAATQAGIATTQANNAASSAVEAANVAAGNIAASTHAATSKATPVDADELALVDSAASFTLKKLNWANLKATAESYFDAIYAPLDFGSTISGATSKATPVDADSLALSDSAASNALKKLTFSNLKAQLPPALSGFSAKRVTAVQTIATDTWTDVVFESEHFDTGSEYNTSNGRFTATVTGIYLFTLSTNISTSGTVAPFGSRLYLNNATVLAWALATGSASTSIIATQCSVIVALTAGDYVTGQAYQNTGGNRDVNNGDYTRFTGIRLK